MRCPPFVRFQIKFPTQLYNQIYQLPRNEVERLTIELWRRHLSELPTQQKDPVNVRVC